ncbi:peptidylprolyl isomerase [Candidatus Woesearchaeota archaeon]|nr:peptidylprolyl isomerase [Candidatus Woesearchaeota archaeon]
MVEKTVAHDFVEVTYTGTLNNGVVFDTTSEEVAHQAGLPHHHGSVQPAIVCIGEQQLLPGLDKDLENKEIGKEYTVILPPESAFGKRDIKNIRIIPMNTFREHEVQPRPGLQVDVDGERGFVTSIAGGRVVVNFNHPLAGKEVTYTYIIQRKITDVSEKISSFVSRSLGFPADQFKVNINGEKGVVELPLHLPAQFTDVLSKKLTEITGIQKFEFQFKKEERQSEKPVH